METLVNEISKIKKDLDSGKFKSEQMEEHINVKKEDKEFLL